MFSEIHTADVLTKVSQLIEATHDDLPCIQMDYELWKLQ